MKSQVISLEFVLNTLIIILLITYTYMWGSDIFQSTIDRAKINKGEKIAVELQEKIERIIKFGGKEEFSFRFDGLIVMDKNKTSGENFISIRIPLRKFRNTSWVYLFPEKSFLTNSLISVRKAYRGSFMEIQLLPGLIEKNEEKIKTEIIAGYRRACSGECTVTIEKIGTEMYSKNGKTVFLIKTRVEIK